jgi:hypothetical protein
MAAPDYTTIVLNADVNRPADVVWKKIGGFCDVSKWQKLSCIYLSGSGDLGTVRQLGDRITEVMIGKTSHSYTFMQQRSSIQFHGTVDVQAEGPDRSKIIYSLVYDQSTLRSDESRAVSRKQRTQAFTEHLEGMKKVAESD